ncbi:hypothetical protein EVAR_16776_1 [Eumeta japonica]|uniref:Uncharacterized protein n=1 Tax=Eumeta variegata TaxID=151549 RepID=A0A4C1UL03_EUMVA|nr:hypothetical protein EVAR_16776_1 [Eumeta japonica]
MHAAGADTTRRRGAARERRVVGVWEMGVWSDKFRIKTQNRRSFSIHAPMPPRPRHVPTLIAQQKGFEQDVPTAHLLNGTRSGGLLRIRSRKCIPGRICKRRNRISDVGGNGLMEERVGNGEEVGLSGDQNVSSSRLGVNYSTQRRLWALSPS